MVQVVGGQHSLGGRPLNGPRVRFGIHFQVPDGEHACRGADEPAKTAIALGQVGGLVSRTAWWKLQSSRSLEYRQHFASYFCRERVG